MQDLKLILEQGKEVFYAYRPLQKILPKLTDGDFDDLREDIRKNGLKTTIKVVKLSPTGRIAKSKTHYVVLDGVHRLKIVKELGLEPKIQVGEVKKEDWLRVGVALNLSAKRGRQMKKRDLVRALYKRYKEKVKDPKIEEFKKELEACGLHLTEKTIKAYLFRQYKSEQHGQRSQVTPPGNLRSDGQEPENVQISTTFANVANSLNATADELLRTLSELAPTLRTAADRFNASPLEVLRKCVETLKGI